MSSPLPAPVTDPISRFRALLDAAVAIDRAVLPEPTAFVLATVADGQPSARVLLLKGADDEGFTFFTNYESRKGRELIAQPRAAMCFHWQLLETQVRIEGSITMVEPHESDAYFASRARGSQIGAWASLQSRPIEHAGDLERRVAETEARFAGRQVPRPPHWGGFRLTPQRIEFWKNRESRLHDRDVYERADGEWSSRTLYP